MRKDIRNALNQEAGQGMTEYIIIVALIAIAAIGVITIFGEQIRDLFGSSAAALSGQTTNQRAVTMQTYNLTTKGLDNSTDANGNAW
jgi:Flp pilus assembly pilin Flp